MRTIILLSTVAVLLLSFKSVNPEIWTMDKIHSKIGFSAVHFGVSDIDGSFKKIDAKFTSSKEDFTDAVFEFTADANSINTEDEQRDAHLKSPDFFDAQKFGTITFKSTAIKKTGDKKYTITGDLTMHGMTKSVDLEATIVSGINLRSKKPIVGVRISGKLNRSSFEIGTSIPVAMISDEITIRGSAEFGKE